MPSEKSKKKRRQLSSERILNPEVAEVFRSYPDLVRPMLRKVRSLIVEVACNTEGVGPLEECLKWGEPSYLTSDSKSGSTVRIDWKQKDPENIAIYFKCTANLVPAFKERYSNVFTFGGNRSILIGIGAEIPELELKRCISLALTYHRNKKLPTEERWRLVEDLAMK